MQPFPPFPDWVALEHSLAEILTQQELHGWYFDESSSQQLESDLRKELEELTQVLRKRHPFVAGSIFTPRRNNQTLGYVEATGRTEKHEHCKEIKEIQECSFTKLRELNTTSRDHISWILQTHYGWTPTLKSSKGKPVVDEIILKDIGTDIARSFLRCLELKKAIGMISEGVNAWNKLVTTSSRIHHHCSVATNTFRCAHRKPNLAQTPSGSEFRKLFTASPGLSMVGADLSAIELRMLAHYLANYDGGRYADILLNGDIHQVNADKLSSLLNSDISRQQVKTVSYCFLYGGGDQKIGLSIDKQYTKYKAIAEGKKVRAAFIKAIPGLSQLLSAINRRLNEKPKGRLLAIDGREIVIDSSHKALNYVLQCSAGVIAKRWLLIAHEAIQQAGLRAHQLGFIHDEIQYECDKKHIEEMRFTLEQSAIKAGEYYNLRIPIAAESKAGRNWSEVH
tara:strand:- start:3212 stop:4564 length:1353 start_codon:yes stop_codon:yes gene_type:complete